MMLSFTWNMFVRAAFLTSKSSCSVGFVRKCMVSFCSHCLQMQMLLIWKPFIRLRLALMSAISVFYYSFWCTMCSVFHLSSSYLPYQRKRIEKSSFGPSGLDRYDSHCDGDELQVSMHASSSSTGLIFGFHLVSSSTSNRSSPVILTNQ